MLKAKGQEEREKARRSNYHFMNTGRNVIPKSTFSKLFVQYNDIAAYNFEEWVFRSGMLFQNLQTWWSNGDARTIPHEGIDFCFFRDKSGRVSRLGKGAKIPVMYDGEIVHIHDDFMGESIYVKHNIGDGNGKVLYTIYGHTISGNSHGVGKTVCEGDIIATMATTTKKDKRILPHVHITTVWMPESLSCEELNWEMISNSPSVILCNPLEFLDCKYKIDNDVCAIPGSE